MLSQDEVIDLLTEYATNERLSRIVEGDEKIRAARIHAGEKYTRLENALTEEQRKLFDSFITADSEMNARMEFLTYQQGLKDMFNLIMSLQDKGWRAETDGGYETHNQGQRLYKSLSG